MEIKKTADYQSLTLQESLDFLKTTVNGLAETEAKERLKTFGRNEITENRRPIVLELLSRFWGPMPWLLELTMLLSYALGHRIEAFIILVLLGVNAGIGYWNERNSQKALELLKSKLTVRVNVRRDGQWVKKNAVDLFPGDVVSIGLGDIVAADLKLLSGEVSMDQSALTGESLPVTLNPSALAYAGSNVKRGEAQGVVLNTGQNTYFGKTAELVKTARSVSHQQQIMLKVIQYMLYVSFGAIAIIVLDALWLHASLVTILNISLIFLMGAVPVALPAVFTVVLATGAMELSRQSVLVTKLSAIEDAATMTILCLDKTGTITQNQLAVMPPVPFNGYSVEDVATAAGMASGEQSQDVIDLVVKQYVREADGDKRYQPISFTPFNPFSKRSEAVVEKNGRRYKAIKGAVQVIASLCHDLNDAQRDEINQQVQELSRKGYRVLAVARTLEADPNALKFMGLLPLADPPRPDSKAMIEEMRRLGVKVKMLTGDNLAIAREIAKQTALGDNIISMPDITRLSEAEQAEALEQSDGVAEIYPEDKHHIVKLLQSRGYIVGMTGDGVNDAPALKQAEVGIAVESATDVAKAAASIVLTEPGLRAIALAIKNSRRIYQRMLSWVINKVTKVVQFVGLLMAGFLIWHDVLISALGMVLLIFANDFITMSLATDRVESTASPNMWNIKKITMASLVLGLLLVVQGLLLAAVGRDMLHLPLPQLQSVVLLGLVFTSLFKVLSIRERKHFWSSRPGKALQAAVFSTLIVFFLLGVFGFIIQPLTAVQVAGVFLLSALFVFLLDFPKYYIFRKYGL